MILFIKATSSCSLRFGRRRVVVIIIVVVVLLLLLIVALSSSWELHGGLWSGDLLVAGGVVGGGALQRPLVLLKGQVVAGKLEGVSRHCCSWKN